MYKLAKWSYQRGVMAERNRIKRVIAELQKDKPEPQHFGDEKKAKPVNDFEIAVWHQTTHELGKLLDPMYGNQYIQQQPIPRIDEDL
jgi:hypothetical protein